MPRKTSKIRSKLNWVECDKCNGWELFENTGIPEKFDPQRVSEMSFTCCHCKAESVVAKLESRVVIIESMMRAAEESVNSVETKLIALETGIVVEVQKMKDLASELYMR